MLTVALVLLPLVVICGLVAVFSAHIPGVRYLTGAAPLVPDEDTTARDFAATNRAHLGESPDEWAARTRLQPTRPVLRKEGP